MPVIGEIKKVPDSIFCELLRSGVLANNETLELIFLKKWWRFYNLPDQGFILTNQRLVFFGTGAMGGLEKRKEWPLTEPITLKYDDQEPGRLSFVSSQQEKVTLVLDLDRGDLEKICSRLEDLFQEQQELAGSVPK